MHFTKTIFMNRETVKIEYLLDRILGLEKHERITEDAVAEALEITPEQYGMLMQGLAIVARKPIKETHPTILC